MDISLGLTSQKVLTLGKAALSVVAAPLTTRNTKATRLHVSCLWVLRDSLCSCCNIFLPLLFRWSLLAFNTMDYGQGDSQLPRNQSFPPSNSWTRHDGEIGRRDNRCVVLHDCCLECVPNLRQTVAQSFCDDWSVHISHAAANIERLAPNSSPTRMDRLTV